MKLNFIALLRRGVSASVSINLKKFKPTKIHKYLKTYQELFITPLKDHLGLYVMVSQRAGVESNQYIFIESTFERKLYKVLEIDYYGGGPPDLWIAKLLLIDLPSR